MLLCVAWLGHMAPTHQHRGGSEVVLLLPGGHRGLRVIFHRNAHKTQEVKQVP